MGVSTVVAFVVQGGVLCRFVLMQRFDSFERTSGIAAFSCDSMHFS